MKILEIKNLGLKIDGNVILENISFDLEKEEILAIIGPNGGGKTTLIRCILGIMQPTSGEINLKSQINIAYIPQKMEFDRDFPISVKEYISIELGTGLDSRSLKMFEEVGVLKLYNQKLGSLSGGELQRLMMGIALSKEPDIIFMDEPGAGIDIGGEETIYSLMHRIQHEKHFAIIVISHDVDFVYKYADRVICLNKRMMCTGIPEKVLTPELLEKTYGKELVGYKHKFKHKGYV